MVVGESKKVGLFSNFRGLGDGTFHGTVDTQHTWSDFETRPLVTGAIGKNITDNATLQTEFVKPVTRRIEDVERITKLLATPGGIKWEAHQAALQTIQNNLENKRVGEKQGVTGFLKNVGKALISDLTLTASTLAQVAVVGTGEHQTPFLTKAYLKNTDKSAGGWFKNALAMMGFSDGDRINGGSLALNGGKISTKAPTTTLIEKDSEEGSFRKVIPESGGYGGKSELEAHKSVNSKPSFAISMSSKISPDTRSIHLDAEISGSGTYYGQLTDKTNRKNGPLYDTISDIESGGFNQKVTVRQMFTTEPAEYVDANLPEGFKTSLNKGFGIQRQYNSSETGSYLGLLKVSRSIEAKEYIDNFVRGVPIADSGSVINPPYEDETNHFVDANKTRREYLLREPATVFPTADTANKVYGTQEETLRKSGLIPFEISSITPEDRYYLAFEANLESYDDTFNGSWDSVHYVGRADAFYAYTGFDRQISFSFKVIQRSRENLQNIYKKLNYLVANVTPTYKGNGTYMRGTLGSVTIGDLLTNKKGIFKSIKIGWKTDYMWEIDYKKYIQVPLVLDVSVSFVPIEDFIPDATQTGYFGALTRQFGGFTEGEM